ncbi:MAG: hypothetical protein EP339_13310 [Gammaproteobacteria bacterium]|nr:MAG: hypothetical protein EP339_13310 [Gammaproteobacteria bacterium]TNE99292.1 MAG: hypothetical protein EP328_03335 [Gammaproteobacteria bacterium]
MFRTLIALSLTLTLSATLRAETFRLGLLHGDEDVFAYEISVIRLALEYAPGDHELILVPLWDAPQNRIFRLLEEGRGQINVFFSGYSPERESRFLRVDVPMTRGLLGYRLLVAPQEHIEALSRIRTVEDLQNIVIGSGIGWPDNDYLEANGLTLSISQYANLWPMLKRGRFDAFHRGVQEVYEELRKPQNQGLAVVPDIALRFRYDYFLFVNPARSDLHRILTDGFARAYEMGALDRHFTTAPRIHEALTRSQLNRRIIIPLETPEAYRSLNEIADKFWYTPDAMQ